MVECCSVVMVECCGVVVVAGAVSAHGTVRACRPAQSDVVSPQSEPGPYSSQEE